MGRRRIDLSALDAPLRVAHAEGRSISTVAAETGRPYHMAARRARQLGLAFPRGMKPGPSDGTLARIPAILTLHREGYTLEQIGGQYGVTRERVRQILKKYCGLIGRDGGARVRGDRKKAARVHMLDSRTLAKHGCTYAQLQELRALGREMAAKGRTRERTPIGAFCSQRANAHRRGIAWNMKLWEWWQLWRESGHWEERGRGQGYVMCRLNDDGPYEAGNVYIALAVENNSKTKQKKSGLPIGVLFIKRGKYERYVAKRMFNGEKHVLGYFKTPEMAHAAYLAAAPVRVAA